MERATKNVLLSSNGDDVSKSLALHLAKRGCRLVLLGNENVLRRSSKEIVASLTGVLPIEVVGLDMEEGREVAFDEAVNRACSILGTLDAFVHAYSYDGPIQDALQLSEDEFKKIVKINLMASWFLMKAVCQRMRDQKSGGSVIFLTSLIGAERGLYPGGAAYGSCSAGLLQLARTSALDVGKHNIRVNAVARGLHIDDGYPVSVGKERAKKLVKDAAPLERWLDVQDDIASTIIYLISDGSRYMTGTTIFVDGAQSLVRPRMRSYM
ncbi:3-oxoacyl-[acyl-carrier-protein] reductase FabG [Benincasa hispida]|uniref:3-oxoacyl-[acyl-carrier-protein] reductase FabG n=1 Tax=Benincasa hispida TaxID=102211 RepID=UPI0018FF943E|nr:3-oxoacyl-[acyl-carrier-protein] reductase FabG [Benincasa hispida]XP_038898635.1 3-oxoacyl-[acyl-carrier-protein] reductase FabG [Benincasa hispida]